VNEEALAYRGLSSKKPGAVEQKTGGCRAKNWGLSRKKQTTNITMIL